MTDQLLEAARLLREHEANKWLGSKGHHTGFIAAAMFLERLAQPASEPKPVDVAEAREALASQLCAKLAEEKASLLAMDDSADQECAHSEANQLGCPECGEEFTRPAPAGVVLSERDTQAVKFAADRLVNVYGDNPNVDFVLALRRIVKNNSESAVKDFAAERVEYEAARQRTGYTCVTDGSMVEFGFQMWLAAKK